MRSQILNTLFFILLGVAIGILINFKGCTNDQSSSSDTVLVKGIPDTVIVFDTAYKYVEKPTAVTKYKYLHDTIHLIGNSDLQNPCDTVRNYTDSIEDGNCKALLNASVRGELLGWSAELFSKETFINRVDTVKIYIKPVEKMRIGVGVAINDSLQPIGFGSISKGRFNFLGGYNLRSRSILIGAGINFSK